MQNYSINKTPVQVQNELALRFKKIRQYKKISQAKMAEKSGVSLGSIKRFEYTGQISLESLLKLVHFIDRLSDFDEVLKMETDLKAIEKMFSI